ncbi:Arm DNA-binding domain-containing protein [Burkholderia plantarii]|uniref:Arm DNA-binding domain-containing protein n=1 Tax=Burkholderia plantarii TaxID=41899 RepID=UPI001F5BAF9D|nr:Arm DNA-binding domain-containing protein [Burkholderia plantarii]
MALTDLNIRTAKPADTQQKLYDGGGLLLLITPAGGKRWLFKYRIGHKEKSLALGTYPAVSLAQAREPRDSAREKPAATDSFKLVAREWFETRRRGWSEGYAGKVICSLEIDVLS